MHGSVGRQPDSPSWLWSHSGQGLQRVTLRCLPATTAPVFPCSTGAKPEGCTDYIYSLIKGCCNAAITPLYPQVETLLMMLKFYMMFPRAFFPSSHDYTTKCSWQPEKENCILYVTMQLYGPHYHSIQVPDTLLHTCLSAQKNYLLHFEERKLRQRETNWSEVMMRTGVQVRQFSVMPNV